MFPITARPLAFIGDRERPVALPPYSSRGAAPCKSIDAVSSKLIPRHAPFGGSESPSETSARNLTRD